MKERRQHKRFRRRFMVRYGERELTHSGFTFDVSRGGAFIVSPYRPPLDAHLHVQIFLDKETSVYFEATVRRHKIIPPELRSVDKGGFGVRFLMPDEVLADILVESGNRLEVAYASPDALQVASDKEFRHGGVFVPTDRELERGSDVLLAMRLEFAGQTFEFDASVVHVWPNPTKDHPGGVGLVFKDKKEVEGTIKQYLK
jgi:Tfp pilus assembly protein PilZ